MKKLLLILLCLPFIGFGQFTYVPDDAFEGFLEANGMGNGISNDDYVNTSSIDTVTVLHIMYFLYPSDLTGIEDFASLEQLNCSQLQLTSLDLSQNSALTELICWGNQLTTINISNNSALINLDCNSNQLTSLDVSQNFDLKYLKCYGNQITSLNVSNNPDLVELNCGDEFAGGNELINLDVSQNIFLTHLSLGYNDVTSLDISNNINLISLICNQNSDYFPLSNLDVSNNTQLQYLVCNDNQLTYLDLTNNIALNYLMCQDNQIQGLDLSECNNLIELGCYDNQLTSLDVKNGNNNNFIFFRCDGNANLNCINVDDAAWSNTNWTQSSFTFDSQHYFSNNCPPLTLTQEYTKNNKPFKVADLLGRETKGKKNKPLFYIYDDGSVEKKIIIE